MMYHIHGNTHFFKGREWLPKLLLAFLWLLGLGTGYYLALNATASFASLMHVLKLEPMSIVGNMLVLTFPLLISAIAVYFNMPFLILPIAFLKAIFFSYSSCGLVFAFGNAGWLIRWLFVFSDSCMIPVLLWFWFNHTTGNTRTLKRDFIICAACALFIGCVDYFIVSPFCVMLFNY